MSFTNEEIIKNWNTKVSTDTFEKIQNKRLKEMVTKMRSWKTMNLYKQNCQHFSSFTKSLVKSYNLNEFDFQ